MKHPPNFLIPDFPFSEKKTYLLSELPKEIQRHIKVLRLNEGERISFLDGAGKIVNLIVKDKTFETQEIKTYPPLVPEIHLFLSPPRSQDALWEALTQSTEIGVSQIAFIKTEHSQWGKKETLPLERAQKISDASLVQCRRPWRMRFFKEWLTPQEALVLPGLNIFADENAVEDFKGPLRPLPLKLFIGPEGGWSASERQLFGTQSVPLSLGSLVLRVPTACVAAAHFLRSLHARS